MVRIPDGLTFRMSTNAKKKTTTIVAYRQGRFKYAYKAVLPMCVEDQCSERRSGPHVLTRVGHSRVVTSAYFAYHQRDVDNLVKELLKTYK